MTEIGLGAVVSVLMRGWTGLHNGWEAAVYSCTAKIGVSSIFLVNPTDPADMPLSIPASILTSALIKVTGLILEGAELLNAHAIPEPTSMTLAGLGAAALLAFRRRK